jgi:hypothetical protein
MPAGMHVDFYISAVSRMVHTAWTLTTPGVTWGMVGCTSWWTAEAETCKLLRSAGDKAGVAQTSDWHADLTIGLSPSMCKSSYVCAPFLNSMVLWSVGVVMDHDNRARELSQPCLHRTGNAERSCKRLELTRTVIVVAVWKFGIALKRSYRTLTTPRYDRRRFDCR